MPASVGVFTIAVRLRIYYIFGGTLILFVTYLFLPLLVFQIRLPSFGVFHQRHVRKQSDEYVLSFNWVDNETLNCSSDCWRKIPTKAKYWLTNLHKAYSKGNKKVTHNCCFRVIYYFAELRLCFSEACNVRLFLVLQRLNFSEIVSGYTSEMCNLCRI